MSQLTAIRKTYKPFHYPWAYDYFLQSEQMHWLPTELDFTEDIEDWKTKMTAEEKTFITHVLRFFTQGDCLHPDSEVLTSEGYKNIKEVTLTDKVAQLVHDRTTNRFNIEFVNPLRKVEKHYDGKLHLIRDGKQRTAQFITDTHKIVYTYGDSLVKEEVKNSKIYQGKKIHTSGLKQNGTKTNLKPIEKLWIAFQADGSVKSGDNGSKLGYIPHRFTFKKQRKVDRLTNILNECGLPYKLTIRDDGYSEFYVENINYKMSKTFDWVDLEDITDSWASQFLDELKYWDGHITETDRYYYYNCNKEAADKVHAIATMSGKNISFRIKEDDRSEKFNDLYVLSWDDKEYRPVDGQSIHRHRISTAYKGMVYCISVPSGIILTRYNNCTAITGNCDIAAAYINNYMPVFVAPELRMMLSSFAAREATHIAAYSHLIESLGLPETTYSEFFQYEEMRKKHDYMASFIGDSPETIAQQLAVFSAFGEGLQLFSSFAMLVNPSRFGKLKGVGQIIAWSQADESLHTEAMIRLFRTLVEENPDIWTDVLKKDIYDACRSMVDLEDAFIDLSFGMTDQEGLSREELKHYIRYIADRRLISLGMKTEYGVSRNPLPWMEGLLGVTQTNFFEQRAVDYAKGALTGSWKDVWKNTDKM